MSWNPFWNSIDIFIPQHFHHIFFSANKLFICIEWLMCNKQISKCVLLKKNLNLLCRLVGCPKSKELYITRDWSPKFATGLKCLDRHRSKSIWVTILPFCHNDLIIGGSLWQKDRMVTHILFDRCLFKHFSPVANFGDQSLPMQYAQRFLLLSSNYVRCA